MFGFLKPIFTRSGLIYFLLFLAASAIAGIIIKTVIDSETVYRNFLQKYEGENLKELENRLLKLERDAATSARLSKTLSELGTLSDDILSRDQNRRRYEVMGDINLLYFKKPPRKSDKEFYLNMSVRFYKKALGYTDNTLQKNMLMRRIAEVYMSNGQWQDALDMFRESKSVKMMPEERWNLSLNMAECCRQLGKYYEAIQILDQVADESREDVSIWGKALREEADIKLTASADMKILEAIQNDKETSKNGGSAPKEAAPPVSGTATKDQPPQTTVSAPLEDDEPDDVEKRKAESSKKASAKLKRESELAALQLTLRREAIADYKELIKQLPELNLEASRARIGILRCYIIEGDTKNAYEIANKIYSSACPAYDKADALMLMAQLEEKNGNFRSAIEILRKCYDNYQKTSLRTAMLMALYKLYKNDKIQNYEAAFEIAKMLFLERPEEYAVKAIIDDFTYGRENLINKLAASGDKKQIKEYLDGIKAMLAHIREYEAPIWQSIVNDASFVFANMLFISGDYDKASEAIAKCMNIPNNNNTLLEKIYYLDMICAQKSKSLPPVAAARAKRYLHKFPEGPNYKEALAVELKAYYDMGMYDGAINTAKRIYVDELNTSRKKLDDSYNKSLWLRTVAFIGECYQQTGDYDRANKIVKAYSHAFLKEPYAPEVFISWAKTAEKMGQIYEAVRRLEVVLPHTVDPDKKAQVLVAQYLLKLRLGKIRDYSRAKVLLGKIEESRKLDPDLKRELINELVQSMLNYSFQNEKKEDFNELLDYSLKTYKDELWPEYWVLHSLTPLFGTEELEAISRKHRKALQGDFGKNSKDTETVKFISEQLRLIDDFVNIQEKAKKFETERGLSK